MNKSIAVIILIFLSCNLFAQEEGNGFDYSKWKLAWEDDFNYKNKKLDKNWISANHASKNLYCSRWRENVDVVDGVMHLNIRKEKRGGQDWTAGSIWTKKKFKYGYFECRYKYAGGEATNNSFWLMTRGPEPTVGKRFEIDINEGHFPNEISTNIHNWTDFTIRKNGKKKHYSSNKVFTFGAKPDYSIQLETPVDTKKVRFVSNNFSKFNIGEFRVYGPNIDGHYPQVLSKTADADIGGLINYARSKDVTIKTSGSSKDKDTSHKLVDGNPYSSWTTQNKGQKWVEFEWKKDITIGCIQFTNGLQDPSGNWKKLISDYKVQYFDDGEWKDISVLDVAEKYNFADEYHTYGFEWSEKELVFYFDGKELRRIKNDFSYSEAPISLSLALIKWSGTLDDSLDGKSMKVDYVKYFQPKK